MTETLVTIPQFKTRFAQLADFMNEGGLNSLRLPHFPKVSEDQVFEMNYLFATTPWADGYWLFTDYLDRQFGNIDVVEAIANFFKDGKHISFFDGVKIERQNREIEFEERLRKLCEIEIEFIESEPEEIPVEIIDDTCDVRIPIAA